MGMRPKIKPLSQVLAEMERTDPVVGDAARRLDAVRDEVVKRGRIERALDQEWLEGWRKRVKYASPEEMAALRLEAVEHGFNGAHAVAYMQQVKTPTPGCF